MSNLRWAVKRELAMGFSPPESDQHLFNTDIYSKRRGERVTSVCQEASFIVGTDIARRWSWSDQCVGLTPKCERCEEVLLMYELAE